MGGGMPETDLMLRINVNIVWSGTCRVPGATYIRVS